MNNMNRPPTRDRNRLPSRDRISNSKFDKYKQFLLKPTCEAYYDGKWHPATISSVKDMNVLHCWDPLIDTFLQEEPGTIKIKALRASQERDGAFEAFFDEFREHGWVEVRLDSPTVKVIFDNYEEDGEYDMELKYIRAGKWERRKKARHEHSTDLCRKLWDSRLDTGDVTISCTDGELLAHCVILRSSSSFLLDAAFKPGMMESLEKNINFACCKRVGKILLHWMYLGVFPDDPKIRSEDFPKVLEMAAYFDIPKLVEMAASNLVRNTKTHKLLPLIRLLKLYEHRQELDNLRKELVYKLSREREGRDLLYKMIWSPETRFFSKDIGSIQDYESTDSWKEDDMLDCNCNKCRANGLDFLLESEI